MANPSSKSEFARIERLPPYVFSIVNELKQDARGRGEDIIDFGMGNPDQQTPEHITDKLVEVAKRPGTHRYSSSKGVPRLRQAISSWYKRRFDVDIDSETEAIVTMGSKEGLAHLMLAILEQGDQVLVPNPAYPIHPYGAIIAGADVRHVRSMPDSDFFQEVERAITESWPRPKMLLLNFPGNPTTECADYAFFERMVAMAKEYDFWIVQDLAYADLVFDGYEAPSILEVPGAKDVTVECFSMSKSYSMPGWRIGFMCGNQTLIAALSRMKSYLDYGMYTPVQVAAIAALNGPQDCVDEIRETYRERRDLVCDGLNAIGWPVTKPKATMFIWAPIPAAYQHMGSLEFTKKLLADAHVAVSPGVGFGAYGDTHVRISLIENDQRTRQGLRNIKRMFWRDGVAETTTAKEA